MARPRKPEPTPSEIILAVEMRQAGKGLASIAAAISNGREAHLASTKQARAKRTVSSRWVGRLIFGKTETSAKLLNSRSIANLRQNRSATSYSVSRIDRAASPVENARVQAQETAVPAKDQVVAKGGAT